MRIIKTVHADGSGEAWTEKYDYEDVGVWDWFKNKLNGPEHKYYCPLCGVELTEENNCCYICLECRQVQMERR